MSSNTPNLGLLKKDPMVDGNETFNIETMLNENWDKIDEAVGQVREELGNIDVDIPEASLTEKGIVQLSSATNGTRENVAATEKAVKAAYDQGAQGATTAASANEKADNIKNSLDTFRSEYDANVTTVNSALAQKAPVANPVFSGTPKVGGSPIITSGNISNYVSPPINYDGNTETLGIYVDANIGNDANDGLTEEKPKRTITAGIAALSKISPRDRGLIINGNFNEIATFSNFVGGSLYIYCNTWKGHSAKIKGIEFEGNTVSKVSVRDLNISEFNTSNPIYGFPLKFKYCSAYYEVQNIVIDSRVSNTTVISGLSFEYSSGYAEISDVSINAVYSGGTAFDIKGVPTYISRCSCNSTFIYGISASSTSVYVNNISGIAARTQRITSGGGQIIIAT